MGEPKTDAERVRWLWAARDRDNEKIVNLETQNAVLREDLQTAHARLREFKYRERDLLEQIRVLGVAVNEANARAATSVQDYITRTG